MIQTSTLRSCSIQKSENRWEPANSANILLRLSVKKQVRDLSLTLPLSEAQLAWVWIYEIIDHVQMTTLTRALKINLNVAYLDGRSPTGKVDFVEFRDPDSQLENSSPITLLYR